MGWFVLVFGLLDVVYFLNCGCSGCAFGCLDCLVFWCCALTLQCVCVRRFGFVAFGFGW